MRERMFASFLYNLSYGAFIFALLGGIYSLTDISEMAFSFIYLHVNDYLIFKAYYSIAVAILSIVTSVLPNKKLTKFVGYAQLWLLPLGPFISYTIIKGISRENSETGFRVLLLSVSIFLFYMGFLLVFSFLVISLYGILENLPGDMRTLVHAVGVIGVYSVAAGILGMITGLIKRVLRKIGKIVSYVQVLLIPFGTAVFIVAREIFE